MKLEEEFKKKAIAPYQKRKRLLDLNILEHVYHINRLYLFATLIALVFFLFSKKYFLFIALTLFSTVFSYYNSKFNRTPMDLKFALLIGVFITRYDGILFTLVFFIISDIVPALLGGEEIDASTIVFAAWYFLINSAVYLFPNTSLLLLGPILVIVEATGSFFINTFFGIPGIMSVMVSVLTILVRIIYFLTLGRILDLLFKTLG